MTVRRLYVPDLPAQGGLVALDEGPSRHVHVLRLQTGDEVELFDGRGLSAAARVESLGDQVVCLAAPPVTVQARPTRVVLMLSVPKGSTLDDCVRMATELGVDEVALVQAERSVPRWDHARARSRVERLTRVAAEAAAQCERADVPIIHEPKSAAEYLATLPDNARGVVFGARAREALVIAETPEQVWCAIGPEGGFTDAELDAFESAGFLVASLGRWILRVDTAVASALTVVQDRIRPLQAR